MSDQRVSPFAWETSGSLFFAGATGGHLSLARATSGSLSFAGATSRFLPSVQNYSPYIFFQVPWTGLFAHVFFCLWLIIGTDIFPGFFSVICWFYRKYLSFNPQEINDIFLFPVKPLSWYYLATAWNLLSSSMSPAKSVYYTEYGKYHMDHCYNHLFIKQNEWKISLFFSYTFIKLQVTVTFLIRWLVHWFIDWFILTAWQHL